ncbi:hypothetical protein [Sporosarcina sp. BP05]|uniref:hypothetical protein n=1 Tax=Sporosarcina sp. BP05 TaxID=2758726 RepID=UPI001645F986|nr:hypothetical protein [Sporosarcina sp. BP05]
MPDFYLVSYTPLCLNATGRKAIAKYKLPPFLDSSVRREPSFEQKFPGISSLCRAGQFAPKLKVDDIVIYITKKGKYGSGGIGHWKLTAVLWVKDIKENHLEAAKWYKSSKFSIPSNCVVPERPPNPRGYSGFTQKHEVQAIVDYQRKSRKFPKYLICDVIFKDLINPPPLYESDFMRILGRIPVTQQANKKGLSWETLDEILQLAVKRQYNSWKE